MKTHKVSNYVKSDGTLVNETIREAHCREKTKGADLWAPTFIDIKPEKWPNDEKFKAWRQKEMDIFLEALGKIPVSFSKYNFNSIHRAEKSVYVENPASNLIALGVLVIYDSFFEQNDKRRIIIHEIAHNYISQISPDLSLKFSKLSGWKKSEHKDIPPKKLVMEDSRVDIEEDFANHIELYFVDKDKISDSMNMFIRNELKINRE